MESIKVSKEAITQASSLAHAIAVNVSDERSSKFGYDIMHGILEGNYVKRLNAWIDWYNNHMQGDTSSTDEERNGIWVPAIAWTPE